MKTLWWVGLMSLLLAACSATPNPTPAPTKVVLANPTATATPRPTQTATHTPIPTSTPTSTPISTLRPQASESYLKQLMQNDEECKLPCFLGVIPEQTALSDIRRLFFRFGLPIAYSYEGDGKAVVYRSSRLPNSEIPPETIFHLENNLVKSIDIYIRPSKAFEWSTYSPTALLKRFGIPSKVEFTISMIHEPSPTPLKGWYSMAFFYDELDFIVNYEESEIKLGDSITVCPNSDDFSGARIWLGKHPSYPPEEGGALEKVTQFTLENFTRYLLSRSDACFDIESKAIP